MHRDEARIDKEAVNEIKLNFELCNSKSISLFGVDFSEEFESDEANSKIKNKLNSLQFSPSVGEVPNDLLRHDSALLSLKDIMLRQVSEGNHFEKVESYIM